MDSEGLPVTRGRRAIGVELSSAYCDGIHNHIGRERVQWQPTTTSSTLSQPTGSESSSATG